MNQEYILHIVKGGGTKEERDTFFKKVLEDPELAKEFVRVKNKFVIESIPYNPKTELNNRKTELRSNEHRNKNKYINILIRVAAVLFIPLLAYFVYDITNTRKISPEGALVYKTGTGVRYIVNPGIKANLMLPDSTRVWLNSGSYLDIPHDFSNDHRHVHMVGEGYFDVKSDSLSPFIVSTINNIEVRVTGTEFNLLCYENDKDMKLTLFSGSLELVKDKTDVIHIRPQEQVSIAYTTSKDNLITVEDLNYVSAWKEGYLRFEDTPIDEVFRKLERWYGVHIHVENTNILKQNFTADFESESLSQVLDLMKITTNIDYQLQGNNVKIYTILK